MEQREAAICQWFDMWLTKRDTGIRDLFAPDAVYIESWGPEYHGADKIAWWFTEWNRRGTVERWDIRQFTYSLQTCSAEFFCFFVHQTCFCSCLCRTS